MPNNNAPGRTPGWVRGSGPRTVGATTRERFDVSGCFEDEWKTTAEDTRTFNLFAKPGGRSSHYGDVNLAGVGQDLIKTLKVQCQKRSTSSTKQEELQQIIEKYSGQVVAPDDTTPLSERCQLVLNPSSEGLGKLHLPTGGAPVVFGGLVHEMVTELIDLDPSEAMAAVDHVFATRLRRPSSPRRRTWQPLSASATSWPSRRRSTKSRRSRVHRGRRQPHHLHHPLPRERQQQRHRLRGQACV